MAAVVFSVASSAVHAGFIYDAQNTGRAVQAWVAGNSVDLDSTTNLGPWYGSAFYSDAASAVIANQGSDFGATQMTFAGGAQTSSSIAVDLHGLSIASTRFTVSSNGSLQWIVTTNSVANGFENMSSMSITLFDLTSGQFLFARTGNSTGNGAIQVFATHNYELIIRADGESGSAGSTAATYNAGLEFVAVPAPGAFALFALAGFSARTRRRSA